MTPPGYRENLRRTIQSYLTTVADEGLQANEGPTEILCLWFDDLYYPAFDPKSFNAGVFEQGLKIFESRFSKEELNALRNFHEYFSSIDKINIDRDFKDVQRDPAWIGLSQQARKALAAFNK